MPLICPQCSHANPDQSSFCIRCGTKLRQPDQEATPANQPYVIPGASSQLFNNPTYINQQGSSQTLATPNAPSSFLPSDHLSSSSHPVPSPEQSAALYSQPPDVAVSSSNPSWIPPVQSTSHPQLPQQPHAWTSPAAPPAVPQENPLYPPPPIAPPPPAVQMGTLQAPASIRRAFAGTGQLVTHQSWLLPGAQEQTVAIRKNIMDEFQRRNINKLSVSAKTLSERGLLIEEREYIVARRGCSTLFVYATPAGEDLYISRATTVLPPISYVRVAVFSLLFLVMLIGLVQPAIPAIYAEAVITNTYTLGTTIQILFALLSFPLLIFFIYLLIRSFIHWLVENDFLVYLRPNTLNDFQLDDIALMEQVTDDIIRSAVDKAGLDASKIVRPPLWYRPQRKFRAI